MTQIKAALTQFDTGKTQLKSPCCVGCNPYAQELEGTLTQKTQIPAQVIGKIYFRLSHTTVTCTTLIRLDDA